MACKICGKVEKEFEHCSNRDCLECFVEELASVDGTIPPDGRKYIYIQNHYELAEAILAEKANLLIARR